MKSQSIAYIHDSKFGNFNSTYSEDRLDNFSVLGKNSETLSLNYTSKKINKYSTISLGSTFDLLNEDTKQYLMSYQYLDECFGVNLDYQRVYYEDRDLKPKDTLTIMFNFKFLGSYASTNLAVSETDKQNIKWYSSSKSQW
mgnify:CR=1 FL=1